jgi:hypothetical protein
MSVRVVCLSGQFSGIVRTFVFFFFLMGFVFCDNYYPTDKGGQQGGPVCLSGQFSGIVRTFFFFFFDGFCFL